MKAPALRSLWALPAVLGMAAGSCGASAQTSGEPAPQIKRGHQLEEVVVTARRREESMQDTPVAVSALSGDDMREKGISNIGDLTKSIPSLQIASPQSNQIYIRGIGERTGFARVDPTVGIYLDGLYIPQTDNGLLDVLQVSSVQVLRGPQGTLFGKNTTGGAIVISLEKPTQEFKASVSGSLGNYNYREFSGDISGPLTSSVSASLGVSATKSDGYMEDVSGYKTANTDRVTGIFQTRWDYSENLVVDSLFYYGISDETVPGINCTINNEDALVIRGLYVMWPGDTDPSNPTAWRENCEANSRQTVGDLKTNMGENAALDNKQRNMLFGTTIDWAFSPEHSMKFIVGWQSGLEKGPLQTNDSDGGPKFLLASYNVADSDRASYSLELQLNGSLFDSKVSYSSGLFYMEQTNTEQFATLFGLAGLDAETLVQLGTQTRPTEPEGSTPFVGIFSGPLSISDFELDNKTLAAYFQTSADLSEALQLTLGLRHTQEERESELEVIGADFDAIANRITGTHLAPNGTLVTFGAPIEGLHPCACSWLQDPVTVAQSLFPDADGDGIPDYPLDYANTQKEKRTETFSETTPMMTLSYNLNENEALLNLLSADNALIYGTWSFGFKSGFLEPRGVDGLELVEPETLENIEIGFKLDAFDRRIRFNTAIYHMQYENMQLFQVSSDSSGAVTALFKNAGESKVDGIEAELTWLPTPGLLVNLSASHNRYEFLTFEDQDTIALVLGQDARIDRSDEGFPVSPETTFALGLQYSWETGFGLITPRLDASYKSDILLGLDPESWDVFQQDVDLAGQKAYTLVDFRLSWSTFEGDTSVALWVRNVFDERYTIGPVATAGSTGTFTEAYGPPREFGVQLSKTFW